MKICTSCNNTLRIFLIFLALVAFNQNVFTQKTKNIENKWTLPYRQCWVLNEQVEFIASDNELDIYLTFSGGKIRKIDSKTSSKIWETDLGNKISSGVFLKPTFLFASTDVKENSNKTNTFINELSRTTGLTNSRIDIQDSNYILLKEFEKKLLIKNQSGNEVVLLDQSGKLIWKKKIENGLLNKIYLFQDIAILATVDKKIILFSILDGDTIFENTLPNTISSFYFDDTGKIFVGDILGNIFSFDYTNQKLKKILRTGGKIINFTSASNNFLITSSDNFIYLVSRKKGKLIWKKRLPGNIESNPLINSDVAFVFSFGIGKGFIIDLKDGKIINKINNPSNDYIIGDPILQNTSLIIPYSSGLYKFDINGCN